VNAAEAKPARRTRRQWRELEAELAEALADLEAAESDVTGLTDRLDAERARAAAGDSSRAKLAREVHRADGRAFVASAGLVLVLTALALLAVLR